jgi:hypothetical protein
MVRLSKNSIIGWLYGLRWMPGWLDSWMLGWLNIRMVEGYDGWLLDG